MNSTYSETFLMAPCPPMITNLCWSARSIPQLYLEDGKKCLAVRNVIIKLRCWVLELEEGDGAGSVRDDQL